MTVPSLVIAIPTQSARWWRKLSELIGLFDVGSGAGRCCGCWEECEQWTRSGP